MSTRHDWATDKAVNLIALMHGYSFTQQVEMIAGELRLVRLHGELDEMQRETRRGRRVVLPKATA